MRLDSRRVRSSLIALVAAAGVIACNKTDDATTNREAGGYVESPTPAPTSMSLRVTEVEIGRSLEPDKRIKDKTGDFRVTDTIYASVRTEGAANGATLTARWTHGKDNQVINTENQTVTSTGDQITEFHIVKPSGWPKGEYKVTILLNGTEVSTKDFAVK